MASIENIERVIISPDEFSVTYVIQFVDRTELKLLKYFDHDNPAYRYNGDIAGQAKKFYLKWRGIDALKLMIDLTGFYGVDMQNGSRTVKVNV